MELLLEHEELLHAALGWAMIATGAVVFAVERAGFFAPYGRYSDAASASWFGPRIPARLAWFVQEPPPCRSRCCRSATAAASPRGPTARSSPCS